MIPVFRRFTASDVPTAPNWISYIFNPLNVFCEQVVQALTKNLVIGENVQGMKYSVTFTTDANYLTGSFLPIKFQYTGGGQPNCLLIGQCVGLTTTTQIPYASWSLNQNTNPYTININYIAGLAASTKYTVTVVVL